MLLNISKLTQIHCRTLPVILAPMLDKRLIICFLLQNLANEVPEHSQCRGRCFLHPSTDSKTCGTPPGFGRTLGHIPTFKWRSSSINCSGCNSMLLQAWVSFQDCLKNKNNSKFQYPVISSHSLQKPTPVHSSIRLKSCCGLLMRRGPHGHGFAPFPCLVAVSGQKNQPQNQRTNRLASSVAVVFGFGPDVTPVSHCPVRGHVARPEA